MKLKPSYLLKVTVLFLLVSCIQNPRQRPETAEKTSPLADTIEPYFLVTDAGDTLPTGVPIPFKGKRIDPAHVAMPKKLPMLNPPTLTSVRTNMRKAAPSGKVKIPDELTVLTPGKNGVPLPEIVPARGKIVVAVQPLPVLASKFNLEVKGITNFESLSVAQGLNNSFVISMFKDSRGDIWFGTDDGVIRYDGTHFWHYTAEEGLSGNRRITSILEDRQGNLWFGIYGGGGITRYDGTHFIHYTTREGLRSNNVWSMLEDSQGNIWIASSSGLTRYDGENFTHFTLIWPNWICTALYEDSKGNIWIGIWREGVFRYHLPEGTGADETGTNGTFTHFTTREGLSHNSILSIMEDSKGDIWFGTIRKGVNRYDGNHFTHFNPNESLKNYWVRSITEDSQGNIWFGTEGGGMNCYDGTHFTNYTTEDGLSNNGVFFIQEGNFGHMWVGTGGGGINRLNIGSFAHFSIEEGLHNYKIRSLLADSKDNVWIGTLDGAFQYDSSEGGTFTHYSTRQGLVRDFIYDMLEDRQGRIWFGTGRGGVSRYDGNSFTTFTEAEGLSGNDVRKLFLDSRGSIWLRTHREGARGVTRYDSNEAGTGGNFTHFTVKEGMISDTLNYMIEDRQGRLWFAFPKGVSCYDPSGEGTITHYTIKEGLSSNVVSGILEDSQGNLWFATNRGPCRYDGKEFQSYTIGTEKNAQIKWGSIIVEDSRGNLWFATKSGILHFNPDETGPGGKFRQYTTADGLSNNWVKSIIEDHQQNIWVATQKGLNLFVPPSGAPHSKNKKRPGAYRLFSFGVVDRLEQENFSSEVQLDKQNRIWWESGGGITMLDLNQFQLPTIPPEIRLSTIHIKERFVDYRRLEDTTYQHSLPFGTILAETVDSVGPWYNYPKTMSLPHDLNHLSFQVSGIDGAAPHKLRYNYLMEGLDEEWSLPTPDNKVDYRNLPHGNYTFKVKAIGSAQIWSDTFEYSFRILPPWWRTWWAYLLYGLFFMLILWAIRRNELNRQALHHQLELENVRAEKLEEINQLKSRFFSNISHEFRTPLTLMLGPVKELIDRARRTDLASLQLIQRNGHRLLNLINQLLYLSKLEAQGMKLQTSSQDIIPFLRQLFAAFSSIGETQNIRSIFHSETQSLFVWFDHEKLEKILLNLLSNAYKFTPEKGTITLDVKTTEDMVELSIADTGPGILPAHLPDIFKRFYQVYGANPRLFESTGIGLALVKELVDLHKGTIAVESEFGKGSCFTICLPLGKKHLQTDEMIEAIEKPPLDITMIDSLIQTQPIPPPDTYVDEELPLLLMVEDNTDMRAYIRQSLEYHFRLVEATDGQQGLDFALKHIPDLILSDVMMPVMGGLELCQKLKSDPRTSHIPIILLTAKADVEARIEGLEQGADAYLAKPFKKEELLIRLQKLFELRKQLHARYQNLSLLTPTEDSSIQMEDEFLQRVRGVLEVHLDDDEYGISQLCRAIKISRVQLHRKLKALTGKSTSHFIRSFRLQKARMLLKTTDLNISEVAYAVGFKDPAYFSRTFNEEFGISPSDAR